MPSFAQRDSFYIFRRADEMLKILKIVMILDDGEMDVEERNFWFAEYKNLFSSRRESWRSLEEQRGNEEDGKKFGEYRQNVEAELSRLCAGILTVIDEHLIPSCSGGESTAFYYTTKGDYYRYLAEFKSGGDKKEAAYQSLKAYRFACTAAESDLSPAHPTRLGLLLNFSVFYFTTFNSPQKACRLAQQALSEAISVLGSLSEKSYEHSTFIMQLLRANLALWNRHILMLEDEENIGEDIRGMLLYLLNIFKHFFPVVRWFGEML